MIKFVIRVSSLVEEDCRTTMLHYDMDIFGPMVYAQQMRSPSLERLIDMGRGPGRMNQVNRSLRRGFIIKTLPWRTRIEFPTKILKEVSMLLRGIHVLHVG